MHNIKLTLQYDGTRYLGWSKPEKDGYDRTVSYKISSVLKKITGIPVTLFAGAKTEPGVHASAQIVNFFTESFFSPEHFRTELNRYLPQDIAVLNCTRAPERFRADLNALSRTYEYRICTSPVYDIFTAGFSSHLFPSPDIKSMQKAASLLIGKHDFRGFSNTKKKKTVPKEISDLRVIRDNSEKNILIISITADDFLYQMPSLIIGTLLAAGGYSPKQTSVDSTTISSILSGKQKAEILCDPRGLLLRSIQY